MACRGGGRNPVAAGRGPRRPASFRECRSGRAGNPRRIGRGRAAAVASVPGQVEAFHGLPKRTAPRWGGIDQTGDLTPGQSIPGEFGDDRREQPGEWRTRLPHHPRSHDLRMVGAGSKTCFEAPVRGADPLTIRRDAEQMARRWRAGTADATQMPQMPRRCHAGAADSAQMARRCRRCRANAADSEQVPRDHEPGQLTVGQGRRPASQPHPKNASAEMIQSSRWTSRRLRRALRSVFTHTGFSTLRLRATAPPRGKSFDQTVDALQTH